MFWRFFLVMPGNPIWDAFMEDQKLRDEARKIVVPFMESIGADHCFGNNGDNYSFTFKDAPDLAIWRRQSHHKSYRPHQRRKNASEMAKAVKALPASPSYNEVFRATGLYYGFPCIIDGNNGYRPALRYYNVAGPKAKLLLQVPWEQYDEDEMLQYRLDNAADKHGNATNDYLQWIPHSSMIEIKEWEALKILDEEVPKDAHHI
jgi:hypothetical protein